MEKKVKPLYITKASEKYYTDYFEDKEIKRALQVDEIENGIILPLIVINEYKTNEYHKGGVIDSNGNFCKLSGTKRLGTDFRMLQEGYTPDIKPEYKDETVIYGGVLYEFYGHVLIETMARLWYYISHNPNKYRVVFDVMPNARGKFKEFFELLDIPYNDDTFITKPTQYKKVIVPELAYNYSTNWHKEYTAVFDYMKSKVPAAKYDKICFSRMKISRGPIMNEKEVMDIFKQNGYKILFPEKMSLKEQIAVLKGAKSFACWAGTLACQVLFCDNGTERIVLNRSFEPCEHHEIFDQCKKLTTYTIDCSLNPYPSTHVFGPWLAGFTEELKEFCDDKGFKYNKKKKTNIVPSNFISPFIKDWVGTNKNFNIPSDEFEAAARKIKKIKFKRTFLQSIYNILSMITTGELKQKLKLKGKGEI